MQYYRDPETGRYFRSLKEVERYVTEGVTPSVTRVKKLDYHHDEKVENLSIEGITPTRTRGKRVNYHRVEKVSSTFFIIFWQIIQNVPLMPNM